MNDAGINLTWSDDIVRFVAEKGFDGKLGARPLQRAIERLLAVPRARWRVRNLAARNITLRLNVEAQLLTVTEQ